MLFDIHLLLTLKKLKRNEGEKLIFQGPSFKLPVPGYAPLEAFLVAFQTMAQMLHAPLKEIFFSFSFSVLFFLFYFYFSFYFFFCWVTFWCWHHCLVFLQEKCTLIILRWYGLTRGCINGDGTYQWKTKWYRSSTVEVPVIRWSLTRPIHYQRPPEDRPWRRRKIIPTITMSATSTPFFLSLRLSAFVFCVSAHQTILFDFRPPGSIPSSSGLFPKSLPHYNLPTWAFSPNIGIRPFFHLHPPLFFLGARFPSWPVRSILS